MNDAVIKHKFQDPILNSLFNEHKAQGVISNLALKSVEEILLLHDHWKAEKQSAPNNPNAQAVFEAEMAHLNAILIRKRELSSDLYGVPEATAIADLDARGLDTSINEVLPEKKDAKIIALNQLPDLGEIPEQKLIAETVKTLLSEGKSKEAEIITRKYYGAGKYVPKKPGRTAEPWNDAKISGWLKEISKHAKPTQKKSEEEPKEAIIEDQTIGALKNLGLNDDEIKTFGEMCDTIEEETKALDEFGIAYEDLAKKGSEDAVEAELLLKAFFLNRNYHANNIQKWVNFILDEENTDANHWNYLGVPGREDGLQGGASSYKEIEETITKKIQEGKNREDTLEELFPEITGKVILDDKNNNYELHTYLHALDFLGILYDESYKKNKPGEAIAQAGTPTDTNTKQSMKEKKEVTPSTQNSGKEEKKVETVKTVPTETGATGKKELSKPVQTEDIDTIISINEVKKLTLQLIRNGGILDDLLLIPEIEKTLELGIREADGMKEFKDANALKDYLNPVFDEVQNKYDSERTIYPFGQMMGLIRLDEENEITADEFVKKNLNLIKKNDGTFLKLTQKDMSPIEFKNDEDFKVFVIEKYAYFEKKRDEKIEADRQALAEQPKSEDKVDTRISETEEKEKSFDIRENMPDIESMNDLIPAGDTLIAQGATLEDLKHWGEIKIMNKQLKEMDENSVIKNIQECNKFIEGLFRARMTPAKESTITPENIRTEIKERLEQKDANLAKVTAHMKEYLKENNFEMTFNDLVGIIKSVRSELTDLTEIDEIVKISESDKELWNVIKTFTTLDEIFNQGKELSEAGEWQKGLVMTLELVVDNNQITDAKDWTDEQATAWYNKMINPNEQTDKIKPDVADAEIIEDEEISTNNWEFSKILAATGKNQFKQAMQSLVADNEMTNECRSALVNAITTQATGSHTKKLAKQGIKALHEIIANTIEKHKIATTE